MVEELLSHPSVHVDVEDSYGVRPLHISIRKK